SCKGVAGARRTLHRYERILSGYTPLRVEEGAFCRKANERVGVGQYGPKYILAVGLFLLSFSRREKFPWPMSRRILAAILAADVVVYRPPCADDWINRGHPIARRTPSQYARMASWSPHSLSKPVETAPSG